MKITTLPLHQIPQLAHTDRAYCAHDETLRPYYTHTVDIESFKHIIATKQPTFSNEQRALLVETLQRQYAHVANADTALRQIELLRKPTTFAVTTAHQPLLFTGSLYFVYKIIATANLAQQLKSAYPQYDFVPVYWIGGEDHDFDEVNHAHIFGKRLAWHDRQGGAVGDYQTESLQTVLDELQTVLGSGEFATQIFNCISSSYKSASRYADATLALVHALFGAMGVVSLDSNDAQLKRSIVPLMEDDLLHHASHRLVSDTVEKLEALGFRNQAFPREINLFYLQPNSRERIVKTPDNQYHALNTELRWSVDELLAELRAKPERFSPNVILRPVFQEWVLPNLAYVGGGGELAYWLERRSQFEHFGVPMPMLVRRPSVLWIDKNTSQRLAKLDLQTTDLLLDIDVLLKQYIQTHTEEVVDLATEKTALSALFEQINDKATHLDASLATSVAAQQTQMLHALEKLEEKLVRTAKKKYDTELQQVQKIKEKTFPQGGLQERYDNFLMYYALYGNVFFEQLRDTLQPLAQHFYIMECTD